VVDQSPQIELISLSAAAKAAKDPARELNREAALIIGP
jgi:hypothetical protein